MYLTPVQKLAGAAALLVLVMPVLLWAGYTWGAANTHAEDRLLSPSQNEDAVDRIAAVAVEIPKVEPDAVAPEPARRLTKAHYISWLEEQLDAQTTAVTKLQHNAAPTPSPGGSPEYAKFARQLLIAASSVAHAKQTQQVRAAAVAVQVLREYWRDTQGETLVLADDLLLTGLDVPGAAAQPRAGTTAIVPKKL